MASLTKAQLQPMRQSVGRSPCAVALHHTSDKFDSKFDWIPYCKLHLHRWLFDLGLKWHLCRVARFGCILEFHARFPCTSKNSLNQELT